MEPPTIPMILTHCSFTCSSCTVRDLSFTQSQFYTFIFENISKYAKSKVKVTSMLYFKAVDLEYKVHPVCSCYLMWSRLSLANRKIDFKKIVGDQNCNIFPVGTIFSHYFIAFYEQRLNCVLSAMQYTWHTITL